MYLNRTIATLMQLTKLCSNTLVCNASNEAGEHSHPFSTMAKESGIWDPLWEFVLNDYDIQEEEPVTRSRSSKSNNTRSGKRRSKSRESKPESRDRKETKRQEDATREEVTEHSLSIMDFFANDTYVDQEATQNGQDQKKAVVTKSGKKKSANNVRDERQQQDRSILNFFSDDSRVEPEAPGNGRARNNFTEKSKKEKPDNLNESSNSSRSWGRQDPIDARETSDLSRRRHPWRRNMPIGEVEVEEKSSENMLWEMVKDPLLLDLNKSASSSKNDTSRSQSRNGSVKSTGKSGSLRAAKERVQPEAMENKKEEKSKRRGFFSRIRRKGSATPSEDNEIEEPEKVVIQTKDNVQNPTSPQRVQTLKLKEKQRGNEDDFNPLTMLMEVAEKIDPWGSTSDSESTSPSAEPSEVTERTDTEVVEDGQNQGDVVISKVFPEPRNFTEVRLTHTPIRESTLQSNEEAASKLEAARQEAAMLEASRIVRESYEARKMGTVETRVHARLEEPSSDDESSVAYGRDRSGNIRRRSFAPIILTRTRESVTSVASRRQEGTEAGTIEEQERPEIPSTYSADIFFKASSDVARNAYVPSTSIETPGENPKNVWQKVVCCSLKNKELDPTSLLLHGTDMSDILPRTRMISDETSGRASIVAKASESRGNDILGLPDNKLLERRGPQNFYNYDYGMNQHMDVQYHKFGLDARSSLVTRRLDLDPSLLGATAGGKLVIQVEVRYQIAFRDAGSNSFNPSI
jgi:hypothetical protein